MMKDREAGYKILCDIFNDGVLYQDAMASALARAEADREDIGRAWIGRLVNGVTEKYLTLRFVIEEQAGRKFSKINKNIRIILLMGLYQGMYMNVPVSAAVNESVKLAVSHSMSGLRGFVNGVLRGIFRDFEASGKTAGDYVKDKAFAKYPDNENKRLEIIYSTPEWIIENYRNYTPDVEKILASQFEEHRLACYVLKSRTGEEELEEAFKKEGTEYKKCVFSEADTEFVYYMIKPSAPLEKTPSFKKGFYIIQDPASMLASETVPLKKEMKVIDVCAAPGGKAIHLADRLAEYSGHVTACDISASKVDRINDSVKRTGMVNMTTLPADAEKNIKNFRDFFDAAVCDLPCSGLGVISRKPDVKYKTKETDPAQLSDLQKRILDNVSTYVKAGGYICFSTCTLTKCENEENVEFLVNKGFKEIKTITLLPCEEHDGFFISILKKPQP